MKKWKHRAVMIETEINYLSCIGRIWVRFFPVLVRWLHVTHRKPLTMRFGCARQHGVRCNVPLTDPCEQFHFANWTNTFLTMKKTLLDEIPICGHLKISRT